MVGSAWWFGPRDGGPSDDPPLRLAALTPVEGTPAAVWPEPLTPDEAPWIAPISPDECAAEPLTWEAYATAKTTDPGPPQGSYEIVGVPDPADAQAVVTVLRAWIACADRNDTFALRAYYTDEFIFFSDFTMDNAPYRDELDRRRAEANRLWSRWATDIDLYPLTVVDGITPPEEAVEIFRFAQGVLEGTETYISQGQTPTTYFEPRFDPADAVLLADGRIMIPTRYIYWQEDPWLQEYGLSTEPTLTTSPIVLENVDGEWKIDESFFLVCIGECDEASWGTMATPGATPVHKPKD
jgi:hypothetical protein